MSIKGYSKYLAGISVLILDRDTSSLRLLNRDLKEMGAKTYLATDVDGARQFIAQRVIHVVLSEYQLSQGEGADLLRHYKEVYPNGLFYFTCSQTTTELKEIARKIGSDGILKKPIDLQYIGKNIKERIQADTTSISRIDPLTELLRPYLIFRSPVMKRGMMILPKLAASNHSVLITGETGTGKEMVARAVHKLSHFSNGPFIAVNCGAIPESLIEGELFGHEKGSFTGAQTLHRGKFELAREGTLFLDEIGEMPLILQARLLRALEVGEIYRVGGEKPIKTNVRIVTATQVNLEEAVSDRLFREDLYYRLNVLRVHIPALRDRIEDIPLLAWHFLERAFAELNRPKPYPTIADETIAILIKRQWRGNVRELKNLMTRLAVLLPTEADQILPEHLTAYFPETVFFNGMAAKGEEFPLPDSIRSIERPPGEQNIIEVNSLPAEEGVFIPVGTTLRDAEEMIIKTTLKHTKGNRTKAAKILDIGLRTIRRKVNIPDGGEGTFPPEKSDS